MTNSLISVVVPVYNVESFLPRAIESVLHQTCKNWEMILVDDGSPDRCGQICDEYAAKDDRIRVIHKKNGGVSSARNAGLAVIRGGYLTFLDPDDYFPERAMEVLKKSMNKTGADIVMGNHSRVEVGGHIHQDYGAWPAYKTQREICRAMLKDELPSFTWGKMYKAELWKQIRFPVGMTMEDMYAMPQVFYKAEKTAFVDDTVYFYSHENEKSIMTGHDLSFIRLHYNKFKVWQKRAELAKLHDRDLEPFCVHQAYRGGIRAFMLDNGVDKLTEQEKAQIMDFLQEPVPQSLGFGLSAGRFFIIHKWNRMIHFLGALQRNILLHQQERRARKNRKIIEQAGK